MTGFVSGGTGLTPFYVLGFELGPWQDYLARELTPDYMADPELPPLRISWLQPEMVSLLPMFASGLDSEPDTWSRFEWDVQQLNSFQYQGGNGSVGLASPGMGFERQLLAPGVFHALNDHSVLGVEAILAYQSYGTSRLGLVALNDQQSMLRNLDPYEPYQESSYGTGVRLAVRSEVSRRVSFGAGFQSRIDMEEFAYYRGVYSSPADFDIPARASFDVAFQANQRSWLSVSIERVLYSDVAAFPSRMLPDRFLSLLGDSTSPVFGWDDLTVYTLGYTWDNGKDTQWRVDVSSRSTPSPTSRTLERALEDDLADHAMMVGYSRRTGDFSRFNLNAAYAPADLVFGGNVLGVATESLGLDLEVEASWSWDF
ncbi:hypothetical protein F3N42_13715 [Marinihelvus fidelis]|uniref:Uncharacterized protein n=1 Tax=Marinihelvus fidelis TaxID=2613842 RepID=A0A5N0T6S0_9GAMM|nr:hypothetical protein [Marinihelvus fidelis]KAA9129837.1 hypothetical protein F3N42_13715 [Marinihelvus fidelis]